MTRPRAARPGEVTWGARTPVSLTNLVGDTHPVTQIMFEFKNLVAYRQLVDREPGE